MKRFILAILLIATLGVSYGQTYYWVGGTATTSFTGGSNWNTQLDGSGDARTTTSSTDVLIIDGSNIGGSLPATGTVTATMSSNTIGQLKLINNATVVFQRSGGGTGTLTISGGPDEDLVIEGGSSLSIVVPAADGTIAIALANGSTGRIGGSVTLANGAHRIVAQAAGALVFESGASARCNTTNYPFGGTSSTPVAAQYGVVFESGADLYYLGGNSPMGNNSAFSAIDFRPGSTYHIRAAAGSGSHLNQKIFANVSIENNTSFTTDGPINKIENFTIESGSSFTVHTSGSTVVTGNLVVDGTLASPASGGSNALVMAGSSPQLITGSGSIVIPGLTVADGAEVELNTNITVNSATHVYGKINFNGNRISGNGTFAARVNNSATGVTAGTVTGGSYQLTGISGTMSGLTGLQVSGTGIAPNTTVVSFSGNNATINLSKPAMTSGSGIELTFTSDTATLQFSHPEGLDSTSGVVTVVNAKTFQSGVNYIVNGATSWPFGITSGSDDDHINAGFVTINAPVTTNRDVNIHAHLDLNSKLTLRPLDTVRILNGAVINGSFGTGSYIVTGTDGATGNAGALQIDDPAASQLFPIGTASHYLPATISLPAPEPLTLSVFEGITEDGLPLGTPLTPIEKQTMVNAVWRINQLQGTAPYDLQLQWTEALEGSTFITLPGSDIGISANNGSLWTLVTAGGDNTLNTASANVNSYGSFSLGAVPQTQPFVFNPLPAKTYGDADFNGGATSLNTTEPIVYSSSDPAVATIVNGDIHITGAGTVTITASQASDGVYPAASIPQQLVVSKAPLTIKADDLIKFEGEPLPILTATYTSFVNGETPAVLMTPVVFNTTATAASAPGTYPITVSGATAANYEIDFVDGVLTVQAKQAQTISFGAFPVKTYGNGDFSTNATSTNNTIPITYTSSNPAVATVNSGVVHIVGAGTTVITASQAGNAGYFPATDVAQTLTVNKAALTIRVLDTTKVQGQPNPTFTITYTGFVLGETAANLTTPPTVATAATTTSPAGYYTLTPEGAATNNYNITYTAGRLTILPPDGGEQPHLLAFMSNSNTLTVRIYSNKPTLGDIVLFDMNGRLLLKRNAFMPKGFMNFNLNVNNIPGGIYGVKVFGDGVNLEQMIPIVR